MIDPSDWSKRELRKLVDKPSFFCEQILDVDPLPYQKSFLDATGPGPANRRIFVAGRQVGKSRSASWYAIWYAVTHAESDVLILAKAQRQAMELFNTLKKELRQSHGDDEWGVPRSTRTEIEFENGARILCLPVGNTGSNIRGYSADLLMVDEAAFVPEHIFQEVLSPMLAVGDNTFIMTSTPLGKKGYFYQRYREAKEAHEQGNEPKYNVTHAKTEDNPYVDEDFIEEQRETLTPIQFKQEILGKFVEASDSYFTTEEVLHEGVAVDERVTKETDKCYLGADVAHTGNDESVYISLDANGNIFDIESTHGKKLTDAMGRIRTLDGRYDYDKIMIDATGLGTGVVDQLEESIGRKVEGFTFTNTKKADLYSTLKDAFQNQEIRFRFERNAGKDENKMYQQLTALEYEYTSTGRMKISHPSGGHDDFCFVGDTMIATPDGHVPIREISVGDLVMTRQGPKPVVATGSREAEVISRFGLTGTPDHPLITEKGVQKLYKASESDLKYLWNEIPSYTMESNIIDTPSQNTGTFGNTTGRTPRMESPRSRSTVKSGVTSMGKSPMDMSSTMKTGIHSTTTSTISSVWNRMNISRCTWRSCSKTGTSKKSLSSDLTKLGLLRLNGTRQRRGVSGIESTTSGPRTNCIKSGTHTSALSAVTNTRLTGKSGQSSAQSPVKTSGSTSGIRKSECVSTAVTRSSAVSTKTHNSVPEVAERKTATVHNITVAGAHEYFANGILVHNCDALALANWARNNRAFAPSDKEAMRPFNMGDLRSSGGSDQRSRNRRNGRFR